MGNVLALALALFALAIAVWTVVPPPILPLLVLGAFVPEYAPFVTAFSLTIALLVPAFARGRARPIACAIAVGAAACAVVPCLEYPGALARAERAVGARFDAPASDERGVRILTGRPVTTRDGAHLALDVYESARPGARPTIVTIYGGAWIFGSRAQMAAIDRHYAGLGYTAIAIDYRHAPAYRFPTQPHDVDDALATIAAHAPQWHVNPERVALLGRSAGAELALLAAYAPRPSHPKLDIRAVVAYYAPTDLRRGYDDPPRPDPAHVRSILEAYVGAPPARAAAAYRAASPLAFARPGLPATFLVGGDRDSLVDIAFQHLMRDALRAHGDRVVAIELPWSNHAFDTVPGGLGASIATPAVDRFLAETFRGS